MLPLDALFPARRSFVRAPQPLALALFGSALALVGTQLSFVRHPLPIIRGSLPLIGGLISLTGQPFASFDFALLPYDGLFALIERMGLAFKLIAGFGAVISSHNSP